MRPIRILGTGEALPKRVVTSAEVEALCGVPLGWAERRAGVRERRWASNGETNASLGAAAARAALDAAAASPADVDLVINASGTAQQPIPDNAALIAAELGLSGVPAFSVHATCLSFLAALDVAADRVALGRARRVLIVSSDIGSVGLNFREPESACLMGDGAAAVLVGPSDGPSALHVSRFETYPEGARLTEIRGGGTWRTPSHPEATPTDFLFHMAGLGVLKLARDVAPDFLERLSPGLSSGLTNVDLVVPHQASLAGLRLMERFGWPRERVATTLETLGNVIAASIPLTLHRAITSGQLPRGSRALLVGTGAGFSIGGAILTY